ncbi:hypothetical protein F4779DRAFT_616936 [Xylariaceae sp. FL0662B]|nr:hypothetical protein F4779DRAFT_616936 [Xylariaceae sp. FL0662B]
MDRDIYDGIFKLQRALTALAEHPERLERYRRRFDRSPPSCHGSTARPSLDSPSEEYQRLSERYWKTKSARDASYPRAQFSSQVSQEEEYIRAAAIDDTLDVPNGVPFYTLAEENVKQRWVEQGIWNDKWGDMMNARWKHEEPLDLPTKSKPAPKNLSKPSRKGLPKPAPKGLPQPTPEVLAKFTPEFFSKLTPEDFCKPVPEELLEPTQEKAEPKPGQSKNEKKTKRARRRARLVREREASRPFHQFIHQVSQARERLEDELGIVVEPSSAPEDINTRAYESVKNTWSKRGIWDTKWSILPGMSWKHERPLRDFLDDELLAFAKEHCPKDVKSPPDTKIKALGPTRPSKVAKHARAKRRTLRGESRSSKQSPFRDGSSSSEDDNQAPKGEGSQSPSKDWSEFFVFMGSPNISYKGNLDSPEAPRTPGSKSPKGGERSEVETISLKDSSKPKGIAKKRRSEKHKHK